MTCFAEATVRSRTKNAINGRWGWGPRQRSFDASPSLFPFYLYVVKKWGPRQNRLVFGRLKSKVTPQLRSGTMLISACMMARCLEEPAIEVSSGLLYQIDPFESNSFTSYSFFKKKKVGGGLEGVPCY